MKYAITIHTENCGDALIVKEADTKEEAIAQIDLCFPWSLKQCDAVTEERFGGFAELF